MDGLALSCLPTRGGREPRLVRRAGGQVGALEEPGGDRRWLR